MNRYKSSQKWRKVSRSHYESPDGRYWAVRKDGSWWMVYVPENIEEKSRRSWGPYATLADCQEIADRAEVDRQLIEVGGKPGETSCPICAADYGPSDSYPWHWPDEDCRAIREPVV